MSSPTLSDIRQAAERIRPYAHHTPVLTCASLDTSGSGCSCTASSSQCNCS